MTAAAGAIITPTNGGEERNFSGKTNFLGQKEEDSFVSFPASPLPLSAELKEEEEQCPEQSLSFHRLGQLELPLSAEQPTPRKEGPDEDYTSLIKRFEIDEHASFKNALRGNLLSFPFEEKEKEGEDDSFLRTQPENFHRHSFPLSPPLSSPEIQIATPQQPASALPLFLKRELQSEKSRCYSEDSFEGLVQRFNIDQYSSNLSPIYPRSTPCSPFPHSPHPSSGRPSNPSAEHLLPRSRPSAFSKPSTHRRTNPQRSLNPVPRNFRRKEPCRKGPPLFPLTLKNRFFKPSNPKESKAMENMVLHKPIPRAFQAPCYLPASFILTSRQPKPRTIAPLTSKSKVHCQPRKKFPFHRPPLTSRLPVS